MTREEGKALRSFVECSRSFSYFCRKLSCLARHASLGCSRVGLVLVLSVAMEGKAPLMTAGEQYGMRINSLAEAMRPDLRGDDRLLYASQTDWERSRNIIRSAEEHAPAVRRCC
jgi:hypothetical protein